METHTQLITSAGQFQTKTGSTGGGSIYAVHEYCVRNICDLHRDIFLKNYTASIAFPAIWLQHIFINTRATDDCIKHTPFIPPLSRLVFCFLLPNLSLDPFFIALSFSRKSSVFSNLASAFIADKWNLFYVSGVASGANPIFFQFWRLTSERHSLPFLSNFPVFWDVIVCLAQLCSAIIDDGAYQKMSHW